MVPRAGLEPARPLKAPDFKSGASTNFAIGAENLSKLIKNHKDIVIQFTRKLPASLSNSHHQVFFFFASNGSPFWLTACAAIECQ